MCGIKHTCSWDPVGLSPPCPSGGLGLAVPSVSAAQPLKCCTAWAGQPHGASSPSRLAVGWGAIARFFRSSVQKKETNFSSEVEGGNLWKSFSWGSFFRSSPTPWAVAFRHHCGAGQKQDTAAAGDGGRAGGQCSHSSVMQISPGFSAKISERILTHRLST